ncbi:histidine kinase [Uliginosibacterium gangwonense]|uniref:histidine kinase n=1 Tax=Uliginosibacterium gangwonense TaxID=392736 RepID=UPI0003676460|nr:histidine kinase [Uliginosibacterium gangwonense]
MLNLDTTPTIQALQAEVVRLNKIISALMNRAEREATSRMTSYGLFQTTVTLENQVRSRTTELSAALRENEQITRKLQLEIEERKRTNQELEQEHEEQRQLIHKLEEAHNQLLQSEKLASIGQLAAGVAHEINNPIGFVYSNLGTLQRYVVDLLKLVEQLDCFDAEREPEQSEQIKRLKQQIDFDFLHTDIMALIDESIDGATRVRQIVQDLRDFSRPAAAEWQLADLHRGLDSTINVAWNEIKYKAEVIREYGDIPEIECLPFQLNQVFLNLLVNAAHAIEKQGKITIRTRCDDRTVTVSISDTGCGIPPEIINRIFDPFFTTKPIGKGTGLGLSVAYGIVVKHNGEIIANSSLGEGTEFVIRLPISQNT